MNSLKAARKAVEATTKKSMERLQKIASGQSLLPQKRATIYSASTASKSSKS